MPGKSRIKTGFQMFPEKGAHKKWKGKKREFVRNY